MATLVRIHKAAKEGKLDNVAPSMSKTVIKGSRGAKKGIKRGPYKKRDSTDSCQPALEEQEIAENVVVENDVLAPLGEASVEMNEVHVKEEEEEQHEDEEEAIDAAMESI